MKKRLVIICAALALAVTGCTAAVAMAANYTETPAPAGGTPEPEGYLLTRYGDGIGVYRGEELILSVPVNVEGLRDVDRELIANGIETQSYDDVLKLLEDFGA